MTTGSSAKPIWLETKATVIGCKYEFSSVTTLTLGIPSDKHFLITFSYYANGKTFTDEFTSPTYLEQGATFSLSYNALSPQQNSKSAATPTTKTPLFAIGIAGSIVLSLIWLAIMHGCS